MNNHFFIWIFIPHNRRDKSNEEGTECLRVSMCSLSNASKERGIMLLSAFTHVDSIMFMLGMSILKYYSYDK